MCYGVLLLTTHLAALSLVVLSMYGLSRRHDVSRHHSCDEHDGSILRARRRPAHIMSHGNVAVAGMSCYDVAAGSFIFSSVNSIDFELLDGLVTPTAPL